MKLVIINKLLIIYKNLCSLHVDRDNIPIFTMIQLFSGDQLIDEFPMYLERNRIKLSDSKTHNYKIKAKILE
jgi:hypothetical protein